MKTRARNSRAIFFLQLTRSLLLTIAFLVFGSGAAFGQGWVKSLSKLNQKVAFTNVVNNKYAKTYDLLGLEIYNNTIVKHNFYRYDYDGKLLKDISLYGTTKLDTFNPQIFLVDSNQNLRAYLNESTTNGYKIYEFDSTGKYKNVTYLEDQNIIKSNSPKNIVTIIKHLSNNESDIIYHLDIFGSIKDSLIIEKNKKIYSILYDNERNKILIGRDSIFKYSEQNNLVWRKDLSIDKLGMEIIELSTNYQNDILLVL